MRILVAYDGSECAEAAVADLQRAGIPKSSEVLIVCVIDAGSHAPGREAMHEGKALVGFARKWIENNFPDWKVSAQALHGSPAEVILEKVRAWKPDLLVVGSHGRSLAGRVFLGSVSLKLSHEAPCPVRVVRPGAVHSGTAVRPKQPIRILIACDGSPESESVIQHVARRSWPAKTEARLVMAIDTILPMAYGLEASTFVSEPALSMVHDSMEQQRARFQDTVDRTRASLMRAGLSVTSAVIEGDPKRALVAEAERWGADTLFVGAHGRGHLKEILLGSVSTAVLNHAHGAVEIVRNLGTERKLDE